MRGPFARAALAALDAQDAPPRAATLRAMLDGTPDDMPDNDAPSPEPFLPAGDR